MRQTIRIDLSSPVRNRQGGTQDFITLYKPSLGDLIECGKITETVYGREAVQEVTSWPAVKAYLKVLLVDVSFEILLSDGDPRDADRIVAALAPFMSGAPAIASAPSASSSSALV